jgi:outer membrane protein TolC
MRALFLFDQENSVKTRFLGTYGRSWMMIQNMNGVKTPPGGRTKIPPLKAVVLLVGVLVCGSAAAQAADPDNSGAVMRISPDEAVALAVKNNLSLEMAGVTLDTKKRKSDLVWNQFLPDLSAGGSLARSNSVTPGSYRWGAGGNFSASLNLSAALFVGIKAIRQDYRAGLVTFEKARIQMERDIRKLYYNMLLMEENIAVLRESFAAAERRTAMAGENYRAGLVPELTWLQARVSMENMKPAIDQAENGFKTAAAQFALQIGLPYDTQFELIPPGEELDFISLETKELVSKSVSGNLDIHELQQNILTLKNQRQAQALQLWTPGISLGWTFSPAFTRDPWKDSWGNGDYWHKGGSFSLGLGISLNGLFPFTKEGQGLKDLDNSIRNANIGLALQIRATEIEIYNTVLSLDRISVTAEAQRMTVDLAEQSFRLTEEAYRAGLQDLLEVENAGISLQQARVQMLEQQYNYLIGLIDLEYATGVPFGTLSSRESAGTEGRN